MTFEYDDSSRLPAIAQPSSRRTNMVYDRGPHPMPVVANPAPASEPFVWFIDALGNRVEGAELPPPDDADEPVIVIRSE